MKILIATGNEGKKKELLDGFGPLPEIEFLSLKDFSEVEEPEENGKTFEENALIKAKYYAQKHNCISLGEDSGLILEAFPDKFGLKTRREIEARDDIHWLEQFLLLMEGEENRQATFYSTIAWYDPETEKSFVVAGQTIGDIAEFPQAPLEKGIPVSAVFIPEGQDIVYSAMTKNEKNSVSHRGKAVKQMADFLKNL